MSHANDIIIRERILKLAKEPIGSDFWDSKLDDLTLFLNKRKEGK